MSNVNKAKFVKDINVEDPVTNASVEISIFKHPNGGMFGIDGSYIDQVLDDKEPTIFDPFSEDGELIELYF